MDRSSISGAGSDEQLAASANRSSMEPHDDSRGTAEQVREKVTHELRSVRDDVERRAADNVNRQKHRVADRLDSIVHALNAARAALQDDDQGQLAGYVGDLTSQVERSTGYLRNNDYGAMMRDMEDLARRNTGLFIGSTFVAGLAMGRFLRSSEPDENELRGNSELRGDDWRGQIAGGGSFVGRSGAGQPDTSYGANGFQSNTFGTYADRGTPGESARARDDFDSGREDR